MLENKIFLVFNPKNKKLKNYNPPPPPKKKTTICEYLIFCISICYDWGFTTLKTYRKSCVHGVAARLPVQQA